MCAAAIDMLRERIMGVEGLRQSAESAKRSDLPFNKVESGLTARTNFPASS
jgi:hypothetical protein